MKTKFLILYILLAIAFSSCRSKKKILYLQGNEEYQSKEMAANYEAIIQPDDILSIRVISQNIEAAQPFNLVPQGNSTQSNIGIGAQLNGYLVNKEGYIEFPILGSVKVAGLTRTAFIEMMKNLLNPYVSDARINLVITNFKVTVLGEVGNPGIVKIDSDRYTLLDAVAESGDLTLQALRKNILIVRDNQGVKSFTRVDITRADFVDSPFYYLKQNDIVYVEARKAKIDSGAFGSYVTTLASILGLLITTTLLIIKL